MIRGGPVEPLTPVEPQSITNRKNRQKSSESKGWPVTGRLVVLIAGQGIVKRSGGNTECDPFCCAQSTDSQSAMYKYSKVRPSISLDVPAEL